MHVNTHFEYKILLKRCVVLPILCNLIQLVTWLNKYFFLEKYIFWSKYIFDLPECQPQSLRAQISRFWQKNLLILRQSNYVATILNYVSKLFKKSTEHPKKAFWMSDLHQIVKITTFLRFQKHFFSKIADKFFFWNITQCSILVPFWR